LIDRMLASLECTLIQAYPFVRSLRVGVLPNPVVLDI